MLSPLHNAVRAGDLERVKELVVSTNIEEKVEGITPLQRALLKGHVLVAKYLLDLGANKEATYPSGMTPLLYAAQTRNIDVVRLLIGHGAIIDAGKRTPLMGASLAGNLEIVEYLLNQGCDRDYTHDGENALCLAVTSRRLKVVQLLMHHGARLHIETKYGLLPMIDIATAYEHHEIADAIRAEGIRRRDLMLVQSMAEQLDQEREKNRVELANLKRENRLLAERNAAQIRLQTENHVAEMAKQEAAVVQWRERLDGELAARERVEAERTRELAELEATLAVARALRR